MVETTRLRELSPVDVDQLLRDGKILLIDVREPPEYAVERIKGALLFALSSFDPAALPAAGDGEVVFHCGSGKRSAMAVARCLDRGFDHPAHMVGGIQGWKAAGLPTITDGTVQGS